MTGKPRLSVLVVAAVLATPLAAQQEVCLQTRLDPTVGTRITVARSLRGRLLISDGSTTTVALEERGVETWFDRYVKKSEDVYGARRTIVESQTTRDGRNCDSGHAGVEMSFDWVSLREFEVSLENRFLPKSRLDRLGDQAELLHLGLDFPALVAAGETVQIRAGALAVAAFEPEGPPRGESLSMTLKTTDPKAAVLRVEGDLSFLGDRTFRGRKVELRHEAKVVLEFHRREARTTSITVKGKAVPHVPPDDKSLSGELTLEATFTAKAVDDARTFKAPAPVFRDNLHREHGVDFRLPSFWIALDESKDGERLYHDSRTEAIRAFAFEAEDSAVDSATPEAHAALIEELEASFEDVAVKPATAPIGRGATFRARGKDDGGLLGARLTIAPGRIFAVTFVLAAAPTAADQADFDRLLASLKRAPA
ncbi:MAG TPA: hypothetical protein VEI02_00405 [Planctomycetota bacterium]|nr:hypothetical protein [Planctomycetota bacterium]